MDHHNYTNYQPNRRNLSMEAASLTLGIISVTTCACLYVSIVCGALSIIFALLSKGGSNTMSSRACLAMIIGIAGIVLTVGFYAFAFGVAYLQYGSIENILRAYSEQAGYDYETLFGQSFY